MTIPGKELVERDQQLRYLTTRLADCTAGRGSATVVSGSVASGKTELLHAFVEQATEAGAVVLTATASRGEQTLPLGVVDQLLHSTCPAPGATADIAALLADGSRARWYDQSPEAAQESGRVLHGLCKALLNLAEDATLVVAVDDFHYADAPSRQCLSSLIRRLRTSRIMVLLAESNRLLPSYSMAHAELLHHSYRRRLQLEPLSRCGVAKVLGQYDDLPTGQLADEYHALTGGNPLLLRAAIEDSRSSDQPVIGDAFGEALLSTLYRLESTALETVRALAALGHPISPGLLGRLLGVADDVAGRAVHLLNRAGLLDQGRFRHPKVRADVLAGMAADECAALHGKVARLLHGAGEPAGAVARHIVLAGRLDEAWVLPTLQAAAEEALTGGEPERALAAVDAASAMCRDERQRAHIAAMRLRMAWRMDPAALSRLPEVVATVRGGDLAGRSVVALVNDLLWFGRPAEATEVLDALFAGEGTLGFAATQGLTCSLLWLDFWFPEYGERAGNYWARLAADGATSPAEKLSAEDFRRLVSANANGPDEAAIAAAERVLGRLRLNDVTVFPALVAISVLVMADRLGVAATWCDSLVAEAAASKLPARQAVILAVRAEISLRQGDVAAAEGNALRALALAPVKDWGVCGGGVLSTLVLAAIAGGKYDDAAGYLCEPVPEEMFRTPFGVRYLYARGNYYLSTNRVRAALSDFQSCGDAMNALRIDLPALVPWRIGLAEANLVLGYRRRSRELAQEQLARLGKGQDRLRGLALRVLAAVGEPVKRRELLGEAVDLLQASGDWLEAARAFADLSDAQHESGDSGRARVTLRTAQHIAKQCHAHALLRRLYPYAPADGPVPRSRSAAEAEGLTELSEAEQRVAALAANGHTNREIASMLYVTISTVEQHLTRVYRKLGVTRRVDLPAKLNAGPPAATVALAPPSRV